MKYLIFLFIISIFGSCGSAQKLLEKTTDDGGKIVVKKEFFSGIDYIHFEKKIKKRLLYSMIYDCECGIGNKINLHKAIVNERGITTSWTAVTDTIGVPKIFNESIAGNRLITPIEFMPITQEEKNLIEEGLSKVNKECCKNPNKPVKEVIGYVRVMSN